MKIKGCFALGCLLPLLCSCQNYFYQFNMWNLNNYEIILNQQYFNEKEKYPFPLEKLRKNERVSSAPFFVLPDKEVIIVWHTKDGKSFSADVKFNVPKSFTPEDGTNIYLIFQGNRIFVCYEILTGPPLTSEHSRYNRRYAYIWNTGWTFSPDDYLKYYWDTSIPIEEYVKKIAQDKEKKVNSLEEKK